MAAVATGRKIINEISCTNSFKRHLIITEGGWDSSVGIETSHGPDGRGFETR